MNFEGGDSFFMFYFFVKKIMKIMASKQFRINIIFILLVILLPREARELVFAM